MFIERKLNQSTNTVELWKCEWEYPEGTSAKKVFISKIGEEQPLTPEDKNAWNQANAICWASGRTLGNIAVFSKSILGSFPAQAGDDALLPCDFVHAGKFRHGAERWWCRTHQTHWGTKADHESYERLGVMRCANHSQPMNYTLAPLEVNVNDYAEVGIWCSLPAALSAQPIEPRTPKIHVHLRPNANRPQEKGIHVHVNDGHKRIIDDTFSVVVLNGKPLERKEVLQAMLEHTIT